MDLESCMKIKEEALSIYKIIEEQTEKINALEDKIKSMLPKGYWYTYDIDTSWKHPKKYSVKKVEFCKSDFLITVKEVFKKKPWPTFTGESHYYLDSFNSLNIYKTAEEAIEAHQHRICPKCGCFMMYSESTWCKSCMEERSRAAKQFNEEHQFYDPVKKHFYNVEYEDELTRNSWRGFDGRYFKIRRLDTVEVIETCNLWSDGLGENTKNLPEIEFLNTGN